MDTTIDTYDFRQKWFINLLQKPDLLLPASIAVSGEHNRHVGPKIDFASVTIVIASSEQFNFVNEVELTDELNLMKFPECAIFGFLDMVMVSDGIGIGRMRLTLKDAGYNPIESSALAFREAGRNADRKFIQILRPTPSARPARPD
jgi:hypothetical protein